jgi:hypothetical protein
MQIVKFASACCVVSGTAVSPSCVAWAQTSPPHVEGFRVVDHGVYEIVVESKGDTPWGKRTIVKKPKLSQETNTICAKRGTQFGVGYIVDGTPDHAMVRFSKRIYLVSAGPGKSSGNLTSYTEDRVVQFGEYEYDGYTAVGVPGTFGVWRFEYWRDTDLVFKMDFKVEPSACAKNAQSRPGNTSHRNI